MLRPSHSGPSVFTESRFVVTGAAGFIGSHLSAALIERGAKVTGIDNFDPFYDRAAKRANIEPLLAAGTYSFHLLEADIRDAAAMRETFVRDRPAGIFHIAALAGVRPSILDPARYAAVNVDGLVSVLEAARAAGCANLVFASSSSVYGNNAKVPFAETDPVEEPISPYAATKRAGELICHTYARLFGLNIAALRFFTVYGPAQRPDLAINKFMRLIAAGQEVPMFGDGSTSRDYTFIDDIIAGVLSAYEAVRGQRSEVRSQRSEVRGQSPDDAGRFFRIYNLGNSKPVALAEMIQSIARVVGRPARITRMPMQPGDVERTFADITRSGAELGYAPVVGFEDGLARQWAWMSRQKC